MSRSRFRPEGPGRSQDEPAGFGLDAELRADLEALRSVSARDLPTFEETTRAVAAERSRHTREGFLMSTLRQSRTRPWLSTAIAVAALAAIMLVVPISYERTIGHSVALQVAAPALDSAAATRIAHELSTALGATNVNMTSDDAGYRIDAQVPSHSAKGVTRVASAFAAELTARGLTAQATVTPRTERVSSSVYAMARDRLEIRVDRGGKTPAQLEADIRAQLEAAGLTNPDVHVTYDGNQTQVQIHAGDGAGGTNPASGTAGKLDLDVKTPGPNQRQIKVEHAAGMTDADLKAEIERQMREQGINATVTVQNGEVRVQPVKK